MSILDKLRQLRNINDPLDIPEKTDAANARINFLQTVMQFQRDANDAQKELAKLALVKAAKG